jgi:large subunit ribosomal protein L28
MTSTRSVEVVGAGAGTGNGGESGNGGRVVSHAIPVSAQAAASAPHKATRLGLREGASVVLGDSDTRWLLLAVQVKLASDPVASRRIQCYQANPDSAHSLMGLPRLDGTAPAALEDSMAFACDYCGKGRQKAHKVSHSNIKSRKWQEPNLQGVRVERDGKVLRLRACTRCIRSGRVSKAA